MRTRTRIIGAALLAATVCILLAYLLWPRQKTLYRMTILPSLGGKTTWPEAINDRGQIVGFSITVAGDRRLFLWDRDGGMRDLGPIDGPADINNEGQIAGTMRDANGERRAFLCAPGSERRLLGTLGGSTSIAMAINNHGQVVGESWTGEESWTDAGVSHAFIWDETHGMRDLRPPKADRSYACAINDRGQVLVFWPQQRVFLWDPDLGFLAVHDHKPGVLFGFGGLNNKEQISLPLRVSTGKSQVRMANGISSWSTLLELRGEIGEVRLNDDGQVLFTKGSRPSRIPLLNRLFRRRSALSYVWDPNLSLVPLDGYVPRETGVLLAVRDLNNNGCVIGVLSSGNSDRCRGVLLEPIPERWRK